MSMIQFFTLQRSLRLVTEQKLQVHTQPRMSLTVQLNEKLKDLEDTLRKTKYSAERAAVASRQQVIILKNAQAAQVIFLL